MTKNKRASCEGGRDLEKTPCDLAAVARSPCGL